ncbi:MAG: DUF3267 domain-containing protein [Verrucomicrobiae bacterium]|nr:DUF3267 domain-containing protein [Verrucomicrobiae bacterium]
MRFCLGLPNQAQQPSVDDSWTPIRYPRPLLVNLLVLLFGLPTCGILVLLWILLTPVANNPRVSIPALVVATVLIIPLHELLHVLALPGFGRNCLIGLWPRQLILYIRYFGDLSRSRFITVNAAPFLALSVLPLLVCASTGYSSVTIAYFSSLNAVGAGWDLYVIYMLLRQVPKAAIIRNQSHWKQMR